MMRNALDYVWLIPFFPLAGTVVNGLFGKRLPKSLLGPFACLMIFCSFLLSAACVLALHARMPGEAREFSRDVFTWIEMGNLRVTFGVLLDPLSSVMILVVTFVGFLIHVYSLGYMSHDPGYTRYFAYLNLFMFAMLTLVLGNSFLVLFIGWELVGLCSYLLIGFWFEKPSAANAGKKAFIVNRVGDFGFLLAMMALFGIFGTLKFTEIFEAVRTNAAVTPWFSDAAMPAMDALHRVTPLLGLSLVTVITLSLFLGATGKSAQIPLYVWLPDAMEGPTPVSALIHAATMVTAGVYMVARCNLLYALAPVSLATVAAIGAATAIFAATIGLVQNDIKRVLAYSTISQLGYMFLALGVGAFSVGIFHLMTHAFFKALLFLGSGSVIHAISGEQDMRYMGGLSKKLKITSATFIIAALAISGVPGLSGFFSKDEILWRAFTTSVGPEWLGRAVYVCGIAAAVMTAFYMFRVVFLTFYGKSRVKPEVHPHESPPSMTVPLMILAFFSIVAGYVGVPAVLNKVLPFGNERLYGWLEPVFESGASVLSRGAHGAAHESHGLEIQLMLLSIAVALLGIFIAWVMYNAKPSLHEAARKKLGFIHTLIYNKYYVDQIYTWLIVEPGKWIASLVLWRVFDAGIIDGIANGLAYLVGGVSSAIRRVQTGVVLNYALIIALGILALVYYVLR
jgi:NADH-quinone oxidoreductase subunit L